VKNALVVHTTYSIEEVAGERGGRHACEEYMFVMETEL
jgi:hypothetical protein